MVIDGKINVAYLIDTISCDTAGTQKQLLEIIRRIDLDRFDPCLICLWRSEWMVLNELPCACIVLGYQGFIKKSFPGVVSRLVKAVADRKLHIIQTFYEDSIFIGFFAKILVRGPLVLLSSRRDIGLGRENQPWYHSLFALALPKVNRYFNGILANSEQVSLYVAKKEKTDLAKIKVIRNGIDIPPKPLELPLLFSKESGEIWLGIVASLTPVKRHDVLIKAIAELCSRGVNLNFRVLLLGEGPEYSNLIKMVAELNLQDHICFGGVVQDVVPYLYHIDIGILCSDREGLSNAILEYMACRLPVVASSVGGNVELVDADNGICFPPGDHLALALALQKLLEDSTLRKKLGAGSIKKIRESFSWDKSMSELEDYYIDLMGKAL